MVGLGRMGSNMVRRLMQGGHDCVVFDLNPSTVSQLKSEGATAASSIEQLIELLEAPRKVWVMVPAGEPTEAAIDALAGAMDRGDIIVDGGNTYYKDDIRRARSMSDKGMRLVDVGTSGGVRGLERGYCLMVGGDRQAFDEVEPVLRTLSPGGGETKPTAGRRKPSTADEGYLYCGPAGAGHFVKMIHNGIEYGLMQAYAEGFDILKNAAGFEFDLGEVAEVWRRGSVVGSWLLDLTAEALQEDGKLSGYSGFVDDSGEGRWTIMAAIEEAVPVDVLSASLYARFRSRQTHTFAEKVLSAMRHKFGGHIERPGGD